MGIRTYMHGNLTLSFFPLSFCLSFLFSFCSLSLSLSLSLACKYELHRRTTDTHAARLDASPSKPTQGRMV